jgi:hypothetical protein
MLYMVTFTINIPPMLVYIPYMDPMGYILLYRIIIYNICIVCIYIYIYELFYASIYNIIDVVMFFFSNDTVSCLVLL